MAQQYGLGRGLASLIPPKKNDDPAAVERAAEPTYPEAGTQRMNPFITPTEPGNNAGEGPNILPEAEKSALREVAITDIVPNPHQPRLHFDEVKLQELVDSIKEHGILQPLVVTEEGGKYELIAGERRFQAARKAGLTTVPVVVRTADEQGKLELAIIENIQRHNLNPIEEAKAYQRLIHEFGLHQEEVAKKMGKSRPAVGNSVRLLHLPVEIQRAVAEGKISEGHARALLSIENPEKQRAIFDLIIKEELTVRETETRVKSVSVKSHTRMVNPEQATLNARAEQLTQIFGTKVKIARTGKGGKVVIEYYSDEELESLLQRFGK